jgi:dTDP-4-amino-4,6-dideoxygalactose transaminase
MEETIITLKSKMSEEQCNMLLAQITSVSNLIGLKIEIEKKYKSNFENQKFKLPTVNKDNIERFN